MNLLTRYLIDFKCLSIFFIFSMNVSYLLAADNMNYDSSRHPLWSHLTKLEVNLLNNHKLAKENVADNLLQLYLVSSGDVRKWRDYKRLNQRLNKWVEQFNEY